MVSGITMSFRFGTPLSAFRILALSTGIRAPAGHGIREGVYPVGGRFEVFFDPSLPYRLARPLLALALTCACLVAGLSAWQARHRRLHCIFVPHGPRQDE